jgi:hypothetical protein
MKAWGSSKTVVCIYQIAQCHVPKNYDLNIQLCENLKPHVKIVYEFLFGKRKGHPSKVTAVTCWNDKKYTLKFLICSKI